MKEEGPLAPRRKGHETAGGGSDEKRGGGGELVRLLLCRRPRSQTACDDRYGAKGVLSFMRCYMVLGKVCSRNN